MTADRIALLDALEHQRHRLAGVLAELQVTDRVRPGSTTFWLGPAHRAYEGAVGDLAVSIARAETAIAHAVRATSKAIAEVGAHG